MRLILFFFGFLLTNNVISQGKTCDLLGKILNLPDVIAGFKPQLVKDSTLILIDLQGEFEDCGQINWHESLITVTYDTTIKNKLRVQIPYVLFRGQCRYYLITKFEKKNKEYEFEILQPCSGLLCRGSVKAKKSQLIVKSIENSVTTNMTMFEELKICLRD